MTTLVAALLTLACLLFALSLPLGPSAPGKVLRRWAGFLMMAALAPAVACGMFNQVTGRAGGRPPSLVGILAGIGLLAIVSVTAYLALAIRGHLRRSRRREQQGTQRRGYQYDEELPDGWRRDRE